MLKTPAELTEGYEEQVAAVTALAGTVTGDEWERATRLAGWSVKDNLSHLVGGALMMLGRPAPEVELPAHLTHIRNEAGRWMENAVEARRPETGPAVAAEFAEVGDELVADFRRRTPEQFLDTVPGPLGSNPQLGSIASIVLFDWWCHEQDVREALDRPGHATGPVPLHARDRILGGLLRTLPDRVAVDRPVRLVLEVTGPEPAITEVALGVEGGLDDLPEDAEALVLRSDLLTWNAVACGRAIARPIHESMSIEGDAVLAERILGACPFTP